MIRIVPDAEAYFREQAPLDTGLTAEVFASARQMGIPVIGPAMGRLLTLLCRLTQSRLVLELGTAVGYSTLFLAEGVRRARGGVVTVDLNAHHCREALGVLRKGGCASWSAPLCADARALPFRPGIFDLIFLDVDQRYYAELESVCYHMLREGGVLVADNTSFADADAFNMLIRNSSRWDSLNLLALLPGHAPERDGICLALKT